MESKELEKRVNEAARKAAERERERLNSSPPAKPTVEQRLATIGERLNKVQVALGKHDARRMRLLVQEIKLHMDLGDLARVYSTAVELAQMARVNVLGVSEAHTLLADRPMLTPMLPPPPTEH